MAKRTKVCGVVLSEANLSILLSLLRNIALSEGANDVQGFTDKAEQRYEEGNKVQLEIIRRIK